MTVAVETVPVNDTDTDEMVVRVTTEDATGQPRTYEIGIDATGMVGDEYVMHGRRTDDGAPDEPAGGGVSALAWDAAAERFQAAGYEVFDR